MANMPKTNQTKKMKNNSKDKEELKKWVSKLNEVERGYRGGERGEGMKSNDEYEKKWVDIAGGQGWRGVEGKDPEGYEE